MFVHVNDGRGSVLLWRRCDTLRTSGFTDDVMFAHVMARNRQGEKAFIQRDSTGGTVAA